MQHFLSGTSYIYQYWITNISTHTSFMYLYSYTEHNKILTSLVQWTARRLKKFFVSFHSRTLAPCSVQPHNVSSNTLFGSVSALTVLFIEVHIRRFWANCCNSFTLPMNLHSSILKQTVMYQNLISITVEEDWKHFRNPLITFSELIE